MGHRVTSHFDKEEILARMNELHNELLKKVDICGQSSATALRNIQVGNGISDKFLVSNDGDKSFSLPLTIVEESASNSRRFQFFYSVGKISHLPKDFTFPHMTLCTFITSWFCRNLSLKTLPFQFVKQCNMKDDSTKRLYQKNESNDGCCD
jgi:hypothetical protein